MAKTRRKKTNKSPTNIYRNSKVVVIENGMGVKVAGYRAEGKQVAAKGENVKAIHIGRVYSGVPRGKTYPYASKKRGGPQPEGLGELTLSPRKTVAVTDGQ